MPHPRINNGGTTRGLKACKHKKHHEHGDTARYEQDGCRCKRCADAKSAKDAVARKQKAYGRWTETHGLVDAEPIRRHLIALAAVGVGPVQVGRIAGINWQTPERIQLGKQSKVQKRTALAIMAIPASTPAAPLKQVSSVGMVRRIRALCAIGWPLEWQARRMGMTRNQIDHALYGGGTSAWKAQRVRELYDELRETPPVLSTPAEKSSSRAVEARARRMGWAPPIAWDDDEIDDPDATPDPGWSERPGLNAGRGKKVDWDAVAEDLDFMRRTFVNPEEAARRIGYSQVYLQQRLSKTGHGDLSWWISKRRIRQEAS